MSSLSHLNVEAAEHEVTSTETADAQETAMGALLLQAGEAALQKKNVKVARVDLIKARKLLHAEKNFKLEARALILLSQLEAAATNRRLSASYAALAKALENEIGSGMREPQTDQPGEKLANVAVGSTELSATEPTDAGTHDALGNQGNEDTGRPAGNPDVLQKFNVHPDADGDALAAVIEVSPKWDAGDTTDVAPAVAGTPVQHETTGPSVLTALAIMLGAWGLVSSLLILRHRRRR